MHFLTTEIADAAIANLPDSFDSHAFIREIMTIAPQEYVRELNRFADQPDPITSAHAQIARWLLSFRTLQPQGKVVSENIRGQETSNERWQKPVEGAPE